MLEDAFHFSVEAQERFNGERRAIIECATLRGVGGDVVMMTVYNSARVPLLPHFCLVFIFSQCDVPQGGPIRCALCRLRIFKVNASSPFSFPCALRLPESVDYC